MSRNCFLLGGCSFAPGGINNTVHAMHRGDASFGLLFAIHTAAPHLSQAPTVDCVAGSLWTTRQHISTRSSAMLDLRNIALSTNATDRFAADARPTVLMVFKRAAIYD
jgi:hypothetical protein